MDYRAPAPDAPLFIVSTQVIALDRNTGQQRWIYQLDGVARRYAFDENRIFVFESGGILHCLEIATGNLIGRVETFLQSANNMLVDGERIYVCNDDYVVALTSTGQIMWRKSVKTNASHSLAGLGIPGGNVIQPDFSKSG